jgi:hypothetical protein
VDDTVDLLVLRPHVEPEDRAAIVNALHVESKELGGFALAHAAADQFGSHLLFPAQFA